MDKKRKLNNATKNTGTQGRLQTREVRDNRTTAATTTINVQRINANAYIDIHTNITTMQRIQSGSQVHQPEGV